METEPQMDLAKFQESLTPQRMRTFQVIFGALIMGVILFLGMILLLNINTKPATIADTSQSSFLAILTMVHVAQAAVLYIIAFFIYGYLISRKGFEFLQKQTRQHNPIHNESPIEQRYCGAIFTASILRAAAMEGVALFGLIICMVGVQSGEIHTEPIYWLNLLSCLIFIITMLATFPTRQRLENIFKETFNIL